MPAPVTPGRETGNGGPVGDRFVPHRPAWINTGLQRVLRFENVPSLARFRFLFLIRRHRAPSAGSP